MTPHLHDKFVPGCYRCDLGLDGERRAIVEQRDEATDLLRRVWRGGPRLSIQLEAEIDAWLEANQ